MEVDQAETRQEGGYTFLRSMYAIDQETAQTKSLHTQIKASLFPILSILKHPWSLVFCNYGFYEEDARFTAFFYYSDEAELELVKPIVAYHRLPVLFRPGGLSIGFDTGKYGMLLRPQDEDGTVTCGSTLGPEDDFRQGGTLGFIFQDKNSSKYFGVSCAHVVGNAVRVQSPFALDLKYTMEHSEKNLRTAKEYLSSCIPGVPSSERIHRIQVHEKTSREQLERLQAIQPFLGDVRYTAKKFYRPAGSDKTFHVMDFALIELVRSRLCEDPTTFVEVVEPIVGLRVFKIDRTTGRTTGTISYYNAEHRYTHVGEACERTERIETWQICTKDGRPFSDKGDSGAAVMVEDSLNIVGMLFGGNAKDQEFKRYDVSFMIPVSEILRRCEKLGVSPQD